MSAIQFSLEIGLVFLLGVTLIQAIRLERALGVLRRARAGLEPLVEEFDASTRQAEAAIARLHEAAESAGRQVGRQTDTAISLKDDLAFLVERGDRLADRIDGLVRSARPLAAAPRLVAERAVAEQADAAPQFSHPARHLPAEGIAPRMPAPAARAGRTPPVGPAANESRADADPAAAVFRRDGQRVRSQAERDLLKALRVAR